MIDMKLEPFNLTEEAQKLEDEEIRVNEEISNLEKNILFYKKFAWVLIIIGFALGVFGFIVHTFIPNWNLHQYGDYLGGSVASMWSLAGLFIIYVAFLGQKQQLLQQKMELKYNQFEVKATREEIRGQKEQLIEQNKTLRQQRFENTFFQMLNLHHQIVNSIDIKTRNDNYQGRDAFKSIYERFKIELASLHKDDYIVIVDMYVKYYTRYQSDLGHYFRNLYHIFKLVKFSEIDDKYKYTSLVRAQLSTHELLLLFYNCLSENGRERFKPLIEEFHLLKNIPQNELVNPNDRQLYSNSAYEKIDQTLPY